MLEFRWKWAAIAVMLVVMPLSAAAETDYVPVGLFGADAGDSFDVKWEKVNAIAPISKESFAEVRTIHQNMLVNMANQIARIEVQGKLPAVPSTCFTADTPEPTVYLFDTFLTTVHGSNQKFQLGPRWSSTATNGPTLNEGDATTLTVSFPSDAITLLSGVPVENYAPGETDTQNNLNSIFNAQFGSASAWKALFQDVFDKWSERTGLTYVFDVSDDDAPFPSSSGLLNRRGDIRIGGHRIDGSGAGILAYNYYPDYGDMVIDTENLVEFSLAANNYRYLRNVVSHEHGHGLGFAHVCPIDQTKLMEPFINTGFDHSAEDDIRHASRKYGDPNEKNGGNDLVASPTVLGVLPDGTNSVGDFLSLDSVDDVDFYSFTLANDATVSVSLTPFGSSYLEGSQNTPSCDSSVLSTTNAAAVINLDVEVLDSAGILSLGNAAATAAGAPETVVGLELSPDTYIVRVDTADGEDFSDTQMQMYSLSVNIASVVGVTSVSITPSDGFVQEDDALTLTAETTGSTPDTYQWIKDDVDIVGAGNATLYFADLTPLDSGVYKVRVTDSSKATLTSAPYVVNVLPLGALPVGGGLGIALMAGACALAGLAATRRKK